MNKILKQFLADRHNNCFRYNEANIEKMFRSIFNENRQRMLKILDVGCGDGRLKVDILNYIHGIKYDLFGIDARESNRVKAKKLGINMKVSDLRKKFPFKNIKFDIVHGDQVIEHLLNKDSFLQKCHEKLKRGGYLIISTENLSSIDNILALLLGFEPFSQHLSMRRYIGNPFSPHYGKDLYPDFEEYGHKMIGSYAGWKELLEINGFEVISIKGAGYFPLPEILARLDPRHSRFISILAKRIS